MRKYTISLALIASLATWAPALAQEGDSPLKIDLGGLDLGGGGEGKFTPPEYVWAVGDQDVRRWLEDPSTSAGTVKKDARCEVLARKDGFVRVRYDGTHFGWIPEGATTKDKPATAGASGDLPTLQPPALLGGPGKPGSP